MISRKAITWPTEDAAFGRAWVVPGSHQARRFYKCAQRRQIRSWGGADLAKDGKEPLRSPKTPGTSADAGAYAEDYIVGGIHD